MTTIASGSHAADMRGAAVNDAASNEHPSGVATASAYGAKWAAAGPRVI